MKTCPLVLLSIFMTATIALPALRAQTAGATFRPSLLESFSASYSYSGKSGYKHHEAAGETSVWHVDVNAGARAKLGERTFFGYGFAFALNTIDSDDDVPAPERLAELSLNLGLTHAFSPKWRASLAVRPGYYGDMESYTFRTLNVPAMAALAYTPNKSLMWMFGVSVNAFSEYPVMPLASVRWQIDEAWALNLGFPRFGVTWQPLKPLEFGVHLTAQGGGFRVTKSPNGTLRSDLGNTYVNYREIRLGARVAYKFTDKASVSIEGGWMADRRFDYHDRDYELKGKDAAYVKIGLDIKF